MVRVEQVLERAYNAACSVRDALASVSAHSSIADGESLLQASGTLQTAVIQANLDCVHVSRLLKHLGVQSMPEAAAKLCTGGRREAAKLMLDMHGLIAGLAVAQAEVSAFLDECLDSLDATQRATVRQAVGGRLLGSA